MMSVKNSLELLIAIPVYGVHNIDLSADIRALTNSMETDFGAVFEAGIT